MTKILYISYDGMAEPLGQSQVISYLELLSDQNDIRIVSFEKPADLADLAKMQVVRDRLETAGIGWTPLRYHSRPSAPATLYDIAAGTARCIALCRTFKPDIIHARSYISGMIAMALKRLFGAAFLFDIRGFWADERVDGGLWPADGPVFKTVKKLEKQLFRSADHVVTLTEASVPIIQAMDFEGRAAPPITVIPTCADLDRFNLPDAPAPMPFTFGYVGSFGTWYLMDETMALFRAICDLIPDARMLIVNRHEHDAIKAAAMEAGIDSSKLEITASDHASVPGHIHRMHAASALIKPCYSKLSSAPTKLAEYLGCGVPCVGNTGVGDMESILDGRGGGIALATFDKPALAEGARQIVALAHDSATANQCREVATTLFSLSGGVAAYRDVYGALTRN